jgi:hypothetical protein
MGSIALFRTLILAFAFASTPALAAAHYHAEPAAKPAQAKYVLKDIVWKCGDQGCAGGKGSSRPAIVCAVLARQVGPLRSFAVEGQALAAGDLEKCNARAD